MNQHRMALLAARKHYSKCAQKIESEIRISGLSDILSERIIGVGIAADWLRRAAEMESITYLGKQLNNSTRTSFIEIQRFGFSWFGANAIYARPTLLNLLGVPHNTGEYQQFHVLFRSAPLPNSASQTVELANLLASPVYSRLPNVPSGTSSSTLYAIHAKYLSHKPPIGVTGKAIAEAATTGDLSDLDLPTIIYAFRNWSVHGNALDGCFGSRPRYTRFVEIIQQVLADVHVATSRAIHAAL